MRSRSVVATAFLGALLAVAGCSNPDSFVVLSLQSRTSAPITDIAEIEVDVSNGTHPTRTLFYKTHEMMMIDQVTERTLSVGFSGNETGTATFVVTALNNVGCSLGSDTARVEIVKGGVAHGSVSLAALLDCSRVDGGAPDGPVGMPLPGCDPVITQ